MPHDDTSYFTSNSNSSPYPEVTDANFGANTGFDFEGEQREMTWH
jgi:hypothetical protein